MLSNELIEEIIYISSKGKVLDKKIVLKISAEILNILDSSTTNRFNGIEFEEQTKYDKNSYASLNKKNGKIKIYLDEINKKNFKSVLEKNLTLVESIIHEFKHLEESTKILNGNFESLLLMASDNNVIYESLLKNKNIEKILPKHLKEIIFLSYYYRIYSIIPAERIADIEAYELLLKSTNKYPEFKRKYSVEYNSLMEHMLSSYFRGYKCDGKNYSVPLIEYFKKIDNLDTLSVFGFYKNNIEEFTKITRKNFSVRERLKFGLPINDKDQKVIVKKIFR